MPNAGDPFFASSWKLDDSKINVSYLGILTDPFLSIFNAISSDKCLSCFVPYGLMTVLNSSLHRQSEFKTVFFLRIIDKWNNLPEKIVEVENMKTFKFRLRCHLANCSSKH